MKTAIIPADEALPVRIEDPERIDLDYLTSAVGGYIEVVNIVELNLYLNEEGKLHGLPLNRRATELARANRAIFPDDVIVGDAVLTGPVDADGDDMGLTGEAEAWIRLLARGPLAQVIRRRES